MGIRDRIRLALLLVMVAVVAYAQDSSTLKQRLFQEFDYDDPKGTESRLVAFSREAEQAGNVAALAEILTQIARAQALQGHMDEATRTLDRAAGLRTEEARPRVRILIERGRVLRRKGHLQEAQGSFEKAYEAALPAQQAELAADAAHMLAMIVPFEAAGVWVDRGMVLAERSSDPTVRHWVGVIMNNWGGRLDEQGDHKEAALAFARALAARRLEGDASVIRESEFSLAVQLRKLGLTAQALSIQQRLQGETSSANEPDGEILIEEVENLRVLNRKDEAKRVAEDALRSLSAQGAPAEEIDRLRSLLKEMSAPASP